MPQSEEIFFVGTDTGVYGTINGGETWERLGNNMPMVPVYDLTYNPTTNQLVAATFARSIGTYLLDDILQQFTNTQTISSPTFEVNVSPNPTKNVLQIQLAQNTPPNSLIELYNLHGETVFSQYTNQKTITVDINQLTAGMYIVRVQNGKQSHHQKIMKTE
jgi:hypothetical protein